MVDEKTLVIVLGETREHELTFENFKVNVLDVLKADLCVCIGIGDDYDIRNPYYEQACYRFTYPEPKDYGDAFESAAAYILKGKEKTETFNGEILDRRSWREFLKIKDQWMGGVRDKMDEQPGSGAILLFYRWYLLKNLEECNLLSRYDYFVITRSDFVYTLPHPPMDLFEKEYMWFPNAQNYGGITDRHAILPRRFVVSYLDMLPKMMLTSNEYYTKMTVKTGWNLEQFIKFHLEQHQLLPFVRRFPYIMYTVRSYNGKTRWSDGKWSEELGCFIKYPGEHWRGETIQKEYKASNLSIREFYKVAFRNILTEEHWPIAFSDQCPRQSRS